MVSVSSGDEERQTAVAQEGYIGKRHLRRPAAHDFSGIAHEELTIVIIALREEIMAVCAYYHGFAPVEALAYHSLGRAKIGDPDGVADLNPKVP